MDDGFKEAARVWSVIYVIIALPLSVVVAYALDLPSLALLMLVAIPAAIVINIVYAIKDTVSGVSKKLYKTKEKDLTKDEREKLVNRIYTPGVGYYYITPSRVEVVLNKPLVIWKNGISISFEKRQADYFVDVHDILLRNATEIDCEYVANRLNALHGHKGYIQKDIFISDNNERYVFYGYYLAFMTEQHIAQ